MVAQPAYDGRNLQSGARKFAEERLMPLALEIDRNAKVPDRIVRAMAEQGYCGLSIPQEYGGLGANAQTICEVTEELARGCPSSAAVLMAYIVGLQPVVQFGSREQKQKYLPLVARGEKSVCFAVTEDGAGSDVGTIQATARLDGNEWVLNGKKSLIGNAVAADLCIIAAKTDPSAGHKGISAFLVEKGTPGFSVGQVHEKSGMRGTNTAELVMERVRLPASCIIGQEGKGSHYLLASLDLARLTVGAESIGIMRAAMEEAIAYSKRRQTFGHRLEEHQALRFMIANMATGIYAARSMLYDACAKSAAGRPFAVEAAMVKLFASEMAQKVVHDAQQIHGGIGVVHGSLIEKLYRDVRFLEIWEGASEIQRLIIARSVLDGPNG